MRCRSLSLLTFHANSCLAEDRRCPRCGPCRAIRSAGGPHCHYGCATLRRGQWRTRARPPDAPRAGCAAGHTAGSPGGGRPRHTTHIGNDRPVETRRQPRADASTDCVANSGSCPRRSRSRARVAVRAQRSRSAPRLRFSHRSCVARDRGARGKRPPDDDGYTRLGRRRDARFRQGHPRRFHTHRSDADHRRASVRPLCSRSQGREDGRPVVERGSTFFPASSRPATVKDSRDSQSHASARVSIARCFGRQNHDSRNTASSISPTGWSVTEKRDAARGSRPIPKELRALREGLQPASAGTDRIRGALGPDSLREVGAVSPRPKRLCNAQLTGASHTGNRGLVPFLVGHCLAHDAE